MTSRRSGALRNFLIVGALLAVLAGCGPPTLDPSSFKKLENSVSSLREPMEPEQLARFDEALTYMVGDSALFGDGEEELQEPQHPELLLALYKPLQGLTADGVIAEARRMRLEEVQTAVADLEEGELNSRAAREALKSFNLKAGRVFKRNRGFLEWPVIEFRAANGTDETVWLIHFRAALLRPAYEEPWLVESFHQLVLDGLAPGARDVWRIEPEQQEWVTLIDPHPDFQFTLEVMRLEALGGRVILGTEWGDIEEARLGLYRRTLEEIRNSGTLALDRPPRPGSPG